MSRGTFGNGTPVSRSYGAFDGRQAESGRTSHGVYQQEGMS